MIPGAWSRLDEDGGGDQAEELILNGDKAGGLILSQLGSEVRGLNPKGAETRTRPEGLSPTNMGFRGAWSQPEEGGGKTRPERLSSTNMGVPGAWSQPKEDRGGDKAGALILSQYGGFRYVVSI